MRAEKMKNDFKQRFNKVVENVTDGRQGNLLAF